MMSTPDSLQVPICVFFLWEGLFWQHWKLLCRDFFVWSLEQCSLRLGFPFCKQTPGLWKGLACGSCAAVPQTRGVPRRKQGMTPGPPETKEKKLKKSEAVFDHNFRNDGRNSPNQQAKYPLEKVQEKKARENDVWMRWLLARGVESALESL